MEQECILIITDDIGYSPDTVFNAFNTAKKPAYDKLFKEVPNSLLRTSGLAMELPEGQVGNSEVGHMYIGSECIIYQGLVKISQVIEKDMLKNNASLKTLLQKYKRMHIVGLYSDGGVHSLHTHFNALLTICKDEGKEAFAHAVSNGRDVSPKSGLKLIRDLESFCDAKKIHFVSLAGRFHAMDGGRHWEHVEAYYKALLGKAEKVKKMSTYVEESYQKNIFDEFIEPAISEESERLNEEDGLIFINFRNDRMKQLAELLNAENFTPLKQKKRFSNLLTMSVYDNKFNIPVLFEKEELKNTLVKVISNAGLSQLHTAETRKYVHITFFPNGREGDLLENETRMLIPSSKVETYDGKPQMSTFEVCEVVKEGIKKGEDFIVVNFTNGDMVGHTDNFDAAVNAVEAVGTCLGEIIEEAKGQNYAFIITSDHRNCEAMQDEKSNLLTNHAAFNMSVLIEAQIYKQIKPNMGLSNTATSVLKILDLEIPKKIDEALF